MNQPTILNSKKKSYSPHSKEVRNKGNNYFPYGYFVTEPEDSQEITTSLFTFLGIACSSPQAN